jgi:hypothetical protein
LDIILVLELSNDFRTTPTLFLVLLGKKSDKKGVNLFPQSNISYKTIKQNKTLFDCVGKDCFETEEENEEEVRE